MDVSDKETVYAPIRRLAYVPWLFPRCERDDETGYRRLNSSKVNGKEM